MAKRETYKTTDRMYLPMIGWPVYDLRRRKFGICIDLSNSEYRDTHAIAHIEGDLYPSRVYMDDKTYEYPRLYINDQVDFRIGAEIVNDNEDHDPDEYEWDSGYYIKHVHYHVPNDIWQYTISKQGIEGFDRITIDGCKDLRLVKRFIPKI